MTIYPTGSSLNHLGIPPFVGVRHQNFTLAAMTPVGGAVVARQSESALVKASRSSTGIAVTQLTADGWTVIEERRWSRQRLRTLRCPLKARLTPSRQRRTHCDGRRPVLELGSRRGFVGVWIGLAAVEEAPAHFSAITHEGNS